MASRRRQSDPPPMAPHLFQVLLALWDQDLHGYAILKEVSRRTDGRVVLGTSTLYAALQRLVKEGHLEETPAPGQEKAQGPPRKVFRITEAGRVAARGEGFRIQRLAREVAESGVLEAAPSTPGREEGP